MKIYLIVLLLSVYILNVLSQEEIAAAHGRRCPPFHCRKYCPNGFETNFRGCKICECRRRRCPPFQCFMYCPNGFVINHMGCKLCQCRGGRPPIRATVGPISPIRTTQGVRPLPDRTTQGVRPLPGRTTQGVRPG
ncbi:antistasin-like [Gordionus sp. m RMFG-2023]|uniref:antistasin-like n=1 Tax=Gordionus sp. m RMFG-2023 TaxID=3053472 RepID=UPI0031FBDEC9